MQAEASVGDLSGENPYAILVADIRDFAIFLLDLEGRVASWNEGARLLFGYEKAEIVGQLAQRLFVPEDRQNGVPEAELRTARIEGRAEDVRWHLRKDGSRFWANGVMTAVKNAAGETIGFAKIARDDTARKAMEEELRHTADQLQIALDVGSVGTWRWDIPADNLVADANLARFFEVPLQEAAGGPIERYIRAIHPDDAPRVTESITESTRSGASFTEDYRIVQSDGSVLWVEARGKIQLDAAGNPLQLNGVVVDISERKAIEAALRQSEERYSVLFEAIDSGFCVIDLIFDEADNPLDYRFVEINPAFQRQTGIENAIGRTIRELVPELDSFWFETYGKVALSGESVHFESAADAMQRVFDVYAFRIGAPQNRRVALLFTDITASKKIEAEREVLLQNLEFERGRLAAVFQNSPAFAAILRGPQYVYELANPAYYQLVGQRDIIGKPLLEALGEIDGQGFVDLLDGVLKSGVPYEGREIAVQLQREPNDSLEERFVDLLFQQLTEADGTVTGILAHGIDITDQVRARLEAETARQDAEAANRVKDEFLATLSHELRTPLTAIMGWASILQNGPLEADDIRRGLETIERNARAQSQLIEDILDVSRVITGKLRLEVQPVDVANVIDEAVATVTPAAQAKEIDLQRVIDAGASIVSGDPARLQQIAWNLLSNAIKFTPKRGKVQIRLQRINSHLEITVSDSGAGIAPDVLPHVFERFRQADSTSTRSHGGLGLGLAIVRHLVELHGGGVEAFSEGLGKGADFVVKLPLVALRSLNLREGDSNRRVHPTSRGRGAPGNAPRLDDLHVLVVDDQQDTRFFLATVLEKCGARVSLAASASEGFALLQELRPDVLLSDIGMPEADGFSLIKQVRDLPAESGGRTPAAALTAFARVEDRVKVLRSGFQIHLPKPIEPMELITVVANLAGRRDGG